MIQFNLLPDIKLEYIKARRTKHAVMLVSFIVTGVSVGLVILLFVGVNVVQRTHLNNLNGDIKAKSEQLQREDDINKILTVQNQLNSLNGLHDAKPAADRLGKYLQQVTPNEVTIAELAVDFSANTITFDGNADAIKSVNKFIDTLKFTTYHVEGEGEEHEGESMKPFSNVVLASFNRAEESGNSSASASYQITLAFDPVIFNTTKNAKLTVPNQITTRSVTERPAPLFQQNEEGQ
jgi:Tfp pilus assembly protein PilN